MGLWPSKSDICKVGHQEGNSWVHVEAQSTGGVSSSEKSQFYF